MKRYSSHEVFPAPLNLGIRSRTLFMMIVWSFPFHLSINDTTVWRPTTSHASFPFYLMLAVTSRSPGRSTTASSTLSSGPPVPSNSLALVCLRGRQLLFMLIL